MTHEDHSFLLSSSDPIVDVITGTDSRYIHVLVDTCSLYSACLCLSATIALTEHIHFNLNHEQLENTTKQTNKNTRTKLTNRLIQHQPDKIKIPVLRHAKCSYLRHTAKQWNMHPEQRRALAPSLTPLPPPLLRALAPSLTPLPP